MTENHWYFCGILFIVMVAHYGSGIERGYEQGYTEASIVYEDAFVNQKIIAIENTTNFNELFSNVLQYKVDNIALKVGLDACRNEQNLANTTIETLRMNNKTMDRMLNITIESKNEK